MIIREALQYAAKSIASASPILDAEVLLSFVLKQPKEFPYTHPEKPVTTTQEQEFKTLISRRNTGEPVAYLTNHKEFYGRDFYVDQRVLIPRPETELIIDLIKQYAQSQNSIADIGTGSGCIAITLAKELPNATINATDISTGALEVAKKNAASHNVEINFQHGNLLEPIKDKKIDIIVANLPYLNTALPHEPAQAFLAGKDGLDLYRQLFTQIAALGQTPRYVIIEIDPDQVSALMEIIKQQLPQTTIDIKKDLAGLDRILIIIL